MRFARTLTSLLASASLLTKPFATADADFDSVRTRLEKDHSGKAGDPKEKYFHESKFHPHYDGRFADQTLPYDEQRNSLAAMVQAYLFTMADLGAETWVMHGTLIGWWWNRKVLPWDSDVDVQVTLETLQFLRSYYNLALFSFESERLNNTSREYMLEINPQFDEDNQWDDLNRIDARWIDTYSGIFIDITAVRPNETARALGVEGALRCKDKHHYLEEDIFPLRDSTFEGVPCKVPYEYSWLLEEEYGREALTRTEIENHKWNATSGEWEPNKLMQLGLDVDGSLNHVPHFAAFTTLPSIGYQLPYWPALLVLIAVIVLFRWIKARKRFVLGRWSWICETAGNVKRRIQHDDCTLPGP